jgi:glycosyltransferase involved in cell wall biosynthesis
VNGKTGYLVNPGDVNELTEKLGELISDANKRATFGVNARNKAYNEFTIDKMINSYEQIINGVLK